MRDKTGLIDKGADEIGQGTADLCETWGGF